MREPKEEKQKKMMKKGSAPDIIDFFPCVVFFVNMMAFS